MNSMKMLTTAVAIVMAAISPAAAQSHAGAQAPAQSSAQTSTPAHDTTRFTLVVHGGAGAMRREAMTPAMERAYRDTMALAIRRGYEILERGGSALDAVQATVKILEDSELFNAGRGAALTNEGVAELDAAIMDGTGLRAGAVAGLRHVRNPIDLARAVMERSRHVMLIGQGAEAFAREQQLTMVDSTYFITERRADALRRTLEAERRTSPDDAAAAMLPEDGRYGTVGAVAVDRQGRMAAATTTGGMNNKRWGRVGDVPVIGAGTYANEQCAISATGSGEYFIRNVVAYDICARMLYRGTTLAAAADEVVMRKLVEQGGEGGVVAVDRAGNMAMPFNTSGMYRGWVRQDGRIEVRIFSDG